MGPTRFGVLAVVAIVGGVLGWAIVPVSESLNRIAPQVQWTSVVALLAIAAILAVMAHSTYRTVHRDRRHMDPRRAVNFLLLAKASALMGAGVAGAYVGFALQFVDQLDAELPQERVIRSLSAAVAAVVIVIAALLLERACRVPKGDDE